MYITLIVLHLIFATIWIGGHLILLISILPKAIKEKNSQFLLNFESIYEKIGIPSLILQIITGVIMFSLKVENFSLLFDWNNYYGRHFLLKIILLLILIPLALHARFRVIPNLTHDNLLLLGLHIFAVNLLSIGFLLVGVSLRFNLFY